MSFFDDLLKNLGQATQPQQQAQPSYYNRPQTVGDLVGGIAQAAAARQPQQPKYSPVQQGIVSQWKNLSNMNQNGRIQLYGKAMRAGLIDRKTALGYINQEVDGSTPKIDTSFLGQAKGVLNDELQLGKDTFNGVKDGIGNTVNLLGDAMVAPAIAAGGNKQQQQALKDKAAQDFQGSIPGAMYNPLDVLGTALGSSLAANQLHGQGVNDNIITKAVNDQTAHVGLNTNKSQLSNDLKIGGAAGETALNLATLGMPLTGKVADTAGVQSFKRLPSQAIKDALKQQASVSGKTLLQQSAKSGLANGAYGAGSGALSTLQQDNISPLDFVKNGIVGSIGGIAMGTASPYLHAGAESGARAVKNRNSELMNAMTARQREGGFLGGQNATGFKDAQAAGRVFDGVDGKPRFEVSDQGAKVIDNHIGNNTFVGDILDHPELYKQYPGMRDMPVEIDPSLKGNASLNDRTGVISLNPKLTESVQTIKPDLSRISRSNLYDYLETVGYSRNQIEQELKGVPTEKAIKAALNQDEINRLAGIDNPQTVTRLKPSSVGTLIHEIQHEIQGYEGFATGGAPRGSDGAAVEQYRSLAGEAEARAVQARMNMGDGERYVQPKQASEYGMSHRPNEDGAFAYDLTKNVDGDFVPEDVYIHPQHYFQMNGEYGQASKESMAAVNKIRNNPEADVTIYRSGTKGELNNGDWVTLSKKYAEMHQESNGERGDAVHAFTVKAKDLKWPGDDINEFGYYPTNPKPRSTFYDSLDVPKNQLIIRHDGGKAMSLEQPQLTENKLTKGAKSGRQNLSEEVQKGIEGSHAVRNTQQLQDFAKANADQVGLDATISSAHEALAVPMGKIDDTTVAHVQQAIERADAAGRTKDAIDLHDALSEHLTKQGQTIQAASLLYRLSPQGLFYKAMRDLSKGGVKVSPEIESKLKGLANDIKTAPNQDAKDLAVATFHKTVADSLPQGKLQSLVSVWKAGLLSGPITHAGNFASNATFGTLNKLSDAPAALTDKGLAAIGKTKLGQKMGLTGDRTKTFTLRGVGAGTKQGLGTAKETLTTGIDRRNISGNKYETHGELNFKNPAIDAVFGKTSNLVFRAMGAGDQPFYYAAAKNSLYDQALAAGKNHGLKGSALTDFAKKTVDNPTKAMAQQAQKDAQYAVLGQDSNLGSAISKFSQAHPALQVAVPFTKVPTNFLSETLDYTPVGPIKSIMEQVKNVKKGEGIDQRALSQAIGKGATGTGLMVLGSALASAGLLSGQFPSSDQKEQQRWKAQGITPNSIKIGNNWVSLNYLGPVGMLFQAGKDWNDAAARGDNQALASLGGFGKSLTQQSFLTGFTGVSNALQDPQRNLQSFANSQAASIVPNWMNQLAQAIDPNQRQANTVPQSIQSRIPGARQNLPVKQDVYGNGLATRTDPLSMLTNPLRPSQTIGNDVINEVDRLHNVDPNNKDLQVTPTPVNSTISLGNKQNVTLTKDQQYQLQHAVGQATQNAWSQLISTPQYQSLDDLGKANALNKLRQDATANATRDFVAQNNLGTMASKPTSSQANLAKTNSVDKYAKTPSQKATGSSIQISDKLSSGDSGILTKYDSLSANDRKTYLSSSNDAEYKYLQAKYNNDKANGKISAMQDITRQQELSKAKIGSSYSKDARDLYSMSKANIYKYLTSDTKDGKQLADQLIKYDQDLYNAGLTKYLKFKTGIAPSTKKSSGSTRSTRAKSTTKTTRVSKSGVRKASGTSKTAAKSSLTALNAVTKSNISATAKLNKKIASVKVAKKSLPTGKIRGMTLASYKKPSKTSIKATRRNLT